MHGFGISHVETEEDDIAVLDDIIFTFYADLAFLLSGIVGAGSDQVIVRNDLGADKATFEI